MLHPVGWPNHGPLTELYLAEEAIGLVKSLDWSVIKGPSWEVNGEEEETDEESGDEEAHLQKMKELGMEIGSDGYTRFNK